jgi:ABC-type Fe3+ transport system substrate-binding protein
MWQRIALAVALAVVIATPVVLRPAGPPAARGARTLIVVTPHNEQIQREFAEAFVDWHLRTHGEAVSLVYSVPGGTSEIRRLLESRYAAAIEAGRPPGGDADLLFGGGSFEHDQLKRGVLIREPGGGERWEPISAPVDFDPAWLEAVYGARTIGDVPLFDPDRHWFGSALSGFGIAFNRDVLDQVGADPPRTWADLGDPRLRGLVALVNPGQSGSVTTAFEGILKFRGWEEGWRILRRAAANARFFSGSSLKPPAEVSFGNAALGVCIDFYGRYQAEALERAGADPRRIGYLDPPDVGTIDPDPISMLRGAPSPDLARRFIEFCLSDEGQALWQFRIADRGIDGLGPRHFQLRRLVVTKPMYVRYEGRMIDDVDPFAIARPAGDVHPDMRSFIPVLFAAMAIDRHAELRSAWSAIADHPAYPRGGGIVTAADVADPALREMIALFDAMPLVDGPDGAAYDLATTAHLADLKRGWLRGGWADAGLWSPEAAPASELRRRCGQFFGERYRRIVELAK